jgi:hypothetical protein
MNRFNEGKACDAILRHIEAREGCTRQDLRWPEQEGHPAPIELIRSIGDQLYAFEHTGVEPFEGQIQIEATAHFNPLRAMFPHRISSNEYYELHVACGATLGLSRTQIGAMISALHHWISVVGPTLSVAPLGLKGTAAVRQADALIPFEVKLYRHGFPNPRCGLSLVHVVDNPDNLRIRRIRRACLKKFPKLADWKALGARTVLILEGVDDQLTNPIEVAKAVLSVEKQIGNEPDEIYFVMSAFAPWWIWFIRVEARSFFDLSEPDERAWEVDPAGLLPVTAR